MTTRLLNPAWTVSVNPQTGAVTQLQHTGDTHGMNWVCDSTENPWFPDSSGWGLGFLAMPGSNGPQRWQRPTSLEVTEDRVRVTYQLAKIDVIVTRQLQGDRLEESYEFRNRTEEAQSIWGIGLYAPFNDNYPDAATCVTRRCNAHLWCGGNVAYACCLRMGGAAPHLGLVLNDGYLGGYSIEGRGLFSGGSNIRGIMVFNATGVTLKPGASHRIAWTLFWHDGWEDFFTKARQIPGFVDVRAASYTVIGDAQPQITVSDPTATIDALDGETIKVHYGQDRETWLRVQRIDSVAARVQQRVAFIRDRQQVQQRRSPLYGALVNYDNLTQAQCVNPNWADQSEGRERVGMGVLLAQSLRLWPDDQTKAAARRYQRFVRTKLQRPDGRVFGDLQDTGQRLYNYPWAAQLHLEMYRTFGDSRYLTDCFDTLNMYYRLGGDKFYAIGIPMVDAIDTFTTAGRKQQAASLRKDFLQHGDNVIAAGLQIPPHEVNYEQTIIGPAVIIALECYLLTRDKRYLDGAQQILPALEAFNGRQPDHHLHEIAIRHWDGFWFGGKQMWGDTFPHYWSTVTGWAYYRYWQATGDTAYRQRGREILLNNLSAFRSDGSACCVYIYPDAVNGNPGRCWDPLANDQDWALVFLMQAAGIDQGLLRES
ncbi:MAG: six-hairpin glycosidase [Armatimonadota bacterium]